ncbi:hypothetical protein HY632_04935 [Candidatus Uhrbacteria bacterium]|nr:hypothetical protein [Candidatus Uhrbacteria bacterium]
MRVQLPELRQELLAMMQRDQRMRWDAAMHGKAWDWSVDRQHTRRMRVMVQRYGWPTIPKVGPRASEAAWLLVQHADLDVDFQEQCLALVRQAVRTGVVKRAHLALLVDRVAVNRGRRQTYGTQFGKNRRGVFGPRPIRDRRNLDARRRTMGLRPFVEDERTLHERQAKMRLGPIPRPPPSIRKLLPSPHRGT